MFPFCASVKEGSEIWWIWLLKANKVENVQIFRLAFERTEAHQTGTSQALKQMKLFLSLSDFYYDGC